MKTPLLFVRGSLSLHAGPTCLEVHAARYPEQDQFVLALEGYEPGLAADAPNPLTDRGTITQGDVASLLEAVLVDPQADPPNLTGFTTSPASYDWGCTVELERFELAMFPGEAVSTYRKVFILGGSGFSLAQPQRYENFLEEDPRVLAARYAEQAAERERAAAARQADQEALEALPLEALKLEVARRETEGTGAEWKAAHDTYRRRAAAAAAQAKRDRLASLLEGITEGLLLVEPARPAVRNTLGTIPAVPAMIMEVRRIDQSSYGHGQVTLLRDDGQEIQVSPERAAELLKLRPPLTGVPEDGPLRRKIYSRVGSLLKASRHEIDGKVYWAGEASLWSSEVQVVSGETGNAVRAAKVKDRVLAAHLSQNRG